LLRLSEHGAFLVGGDTIVFVSPVAEVYQLAAFGTERTVRVIFPLDGLFAFRTLHKAFWERGKRERGKGKSSV